MTLVVPPGKTQIRNILEWSEERSWGLGDISIPDPPVQRPAVLVPYLGARLSVSGSLRTLLELWEVGSRSFRQRHLAPELKTTSVRVFEDPSIGQRPLVRWELLSTRDLSASVGLRPADCSWLTPHAAILALMAHNPFWVRSMDGDHVPFVWLAGYRLFMKNQEGSSSERVPRLSYNPGIDRVNLVTDLATVRHTSHAILHFGFTS